jgi:uncharacterized membrane protein YkoI
MTKRWSWLLSVALVGVAVPTTTRALADENEENETENETPTSLDKIPPAARDALMREAAGGSIIDVVQETEHGKTVYEAHVRKGNDVMGIKVDQNGKVLGRESEKGEKGHKY